LRNAVNWLLIATGGVMIIAELLLGAVTGFDLLLVGVCLVAGGALGLAFASTPVGLFASGALALVYFLFLRRWVKSKITAEHKPTNVDAIVGRTGVVTARVAENVPGQVKVGDEMWRAVLSPGVPGPREAGETVTVVSVDGVSLQVR
jgi:membrane protein implicated in regulation of membrane protease activity